MLPVLYFRCVHETWRNHLFNLRFFMIDSVFFIMNVETTDKEA